MTETASAMLFASFGFTAVAMLTWFFSTRRRLFIRVFAPADNLREVVRELRKSPDFTKGLRMMAILQFIVAGCFGSLSSLLG